MAPKKANTKALAKAAAAAAAAAEAVEPAAKRARGRPASALPANSLEKKLERQIQAIFIEGRLKKLADSGEDRVDLPGLI